MCPLRMVPCLCLAFGMLVISGCGPGLGTVTGKLTWADGSPAKELEGSQVVFESTAMKVSGRGSVSVEGTYLVGPDLMDKGLPPGEYQVAIIEHRKNAVADGSRLAPAILSEKYADLKTSGLTATLKSGVNEIDLKVERAGKK